MVEERGSGPGSTRLNAPTRGATSRKDPDALHQIDRSTAHPRGERGRRRRRAHRRRHRRPLARRRPPGKRPRRSHRREARPPALGRRPPPEGSRLVRPHAPGLRHRGAGPARHRLHARVHPCAVRLVPRHGRPGDRRQPRHDRRLLRRHVQPRAAPGRHHELRRSEAGRRGGVHGGRRQEPVEHRRGAGSLRPPRQHPRDDGNTRHSARPGAAAGRPRDLQARLPAPVPQGQHGVRGGKAGRSAHRVERQAPGIRDPERTVRLGRRRPLHSGDQQRRRRSVHGRLDERQPRHAAVRRLQSEGRAQRDRRQGPLWHDDRAGSRDLRHELPDGVHGAEAADLRRSHGRLPGRRLDAGAAAEQGTRLRERIGRRVRPSWRRRVTRATRPSSCRPSTASPRRTRQRSSASRTPRSSPGSTPRGPPRTPERETSSRSRPTTTSCSCG